MKKVFASMLAVAMAATMSLSAFAATELTGSSASGKDAGDYTIGVDGTYVAGADAQEVISVDIAWESMDFTYTAGSSTYDPDTHKTTTTDGAWSTNKPGITVTNHSNVAIDASFSFAQASTLPEGTAITGKFYDKSGDGETATYTESTANKLSLASGEDKTTESETYTTPKGTLYFGISGDPITEDKALGNITVKIAKGTDTESGTTENDPKITGVALSGDMVKVDEDSKTYTITVPNSGLVSPTFTVSGTNLDVVLTDGYASPCHIGLFTEGSDSEPLTSLRMNWVWTKNSDDGTLSGTSLNLNRSYVGTYNLKYSNDNQVTWTDAGWTVKVVLDTTSGGSTENDPKITGVTLSGDAIVVDTENKTYTVTVPSGASEVTVTATISGENLDRFFESDYTAGTKYQIKTNYGLAVSGYTYIQNTDGTIYNSDAKISSTPGTFDLMYSNDGGTTWTDTDWDVVVVRGSSESGSSSGTGSEGSTIVDGWNVVTTEAALRSALEAGDKIKLGDNITAGTISLSSTADMSATLDLNGMTLTVDKICIYYS